MSRLPLVVVAALLFTVSCDTGATVAVCGNSVKEDPEQCDKGAQNGVAGSGCSAACELVNIPIASVQVFYNRLKDEAPGFTGSSCMDLGIGSAHVVLEGPSPADEMWPCSKNSFLFLNVTPGTYKVTITLLDASGNALTNPVQSEAKDVAVPNQIDLALNFTQDDFIKQDYRGTLYFVPSWTTLGTYCAAASPPVTQQAITLKTSLGQTVMKTTEDGSTLNGSDGSCFTPSTANPFHKVTDLEWGHYDLTLSGKAAGNIAFCKKFDVFVGPGVATPTYELVATAATACP